ncbi:hypothetical protein [Dyadobacter frigoris]|uniref:DUF2357 domain-containing protein n=1 Tax=Dyadobacter frigoris TaxID=2576211 RepID=A0A4U6CPB2_9BACT|nr:hypothetical protein [Dyadobacter frigoris]TKT86282.1 hypothetical protein FDK13_32745 [Dyadobacter frigoris]GLU56875.1 hypothetical protein Dfri01_63360 [Dyadobacter frigoris]
MFKLFRYDKNIRTEVLPIQGLYTVQELGEYEFIFDSVIRLESLRNIFLEDIPIDKGLYNINENKVRSNKSRFFQDYFGYASLKIGNEIVKFNIQIEKLKISEIEDILLFLWRSENKIFHNFLSKSTLNSGIDKNGTEFGLTSKYLIFVSHFHEVFKKLLIQFQNAPQYVLRNEKIEIEYSPEATSPESINWICSNLDRIKFDYLFQNYPNSILIGNNYGHLDKIQSEVKVRSYEVYENEIILGAFIDIIIKLKSLKKYILSNVNIEKYSDSRYADFRDLKKIPLIKLFEDSASIEKKISSLYSKFQKVFPNAKPKREKAKLTPVFSSRWHYLTAFKTIEQSKNLKLSLEGELQLLNIRKLSQLYEAYNLHSIIDIFNEKLNLSNFTIETSSDRVDGIVNRLIYKNSVCSINIYYELKYPNSHFVDLTRIDNSIGNYYNPDYIIEFDNNIFKSYYIIDSKYTHYTTLKNSYLNEAIFKYILNTGLIDESYKKINHLILLYPGHINEDYVGSKFHNPQISLIISKPKDDEYFKNLLKNIIVKETPVHLLKISQETVLNG